MRIPSSEVALTLLLIMLIYPLFCLTLSVSASTTFVGTYHLTSYSFEPPSSTNYILNRTSGGNIQTYYGNYTNTTLETTSDWELTGSYRGYSASWKFEDCQDYYDAEGRLILQTDTAIIKLNGNVESWVTRREYGNYVGYYPTPNDIVKAGTNDQWLYTYEERDYENGEYKETYTYKVEIVVKDFPTKAVEAGAFSTVQVEVTEWEDEALYSKRIKWYRLTDGKLIAHESYDWEDDQWNLFIVCELKSEKVLVVSGGGLPTGVIAGIAIAFVTIACFVSYRFLARRKEAATREEAHETAERLGSPLTAVEDEVKGYKCNKCGQRDWELVPNTTMTYRCKNCGNVTFRCALIIPPEEADRLRQHSSFLQALEETQKGNWSSALRLVEEVLDDGLESKYLLFLKAWCMTQIVEGGELTSEMQNIQTEFANRFRQGFFDEGAYDRLIDVCNNSAKYYSEAKDILHACIQTYPDFAEAKSLYEYMKKSLPKITEAVKGVLSSHFEVAMALSPREFEKFIAYLFRKIGYAVEVTPYVADFGADVVAQRGKERIVVQVKKYVGSNVGAQEVQQTLGSIWKYKADKAIIVTTTGFTQKAIEQAKGAPIELWNISTLRRVMERHLLAF